jgi:hypothetical protein
MPTCSKLVCHRAGIAVPAMADSCGRALFIAGCFLLPLFWLTNSWLFWPYLRGKRHNAVIEKCAHLVADVRTRVHCLLSAVTRPFSAKAQSTEQTLSGTRLRVTCHSDPALATPTLAYCADARWSAIGFVIVVPPIFAWFLVFAIGRKSLFSADVAGKLDATRLKLKNIGWVF